MLEAVFENEMVISQQTGQARKHPRPVIRVQMFSPPPFTECLALLIAGQPGYTLTHPFRGEVLVFDPAQIDSCRATQEHVLQPLLSLTQRLFRKLSLGYVESGPQHRGLAFKLHRSGREIDPTLLAAFGDELQLITGGNPLSSKPRQTSVFDHLTMIGMDQLPKVHRKELPLRIPAMGFCVRIGIYEFGVLEDNDRRRYGLGQQPKFRFALAKGFFRSPAFGDVNVDAQNAADFSIDAYRASHVIIVPRLLALGDFRLALDHFTGIRPLVDSLPQGQGFAVRRYVFRKRSDKIAPLQNRIRVLYDASFVLVASP